MADVMDLTTFKAWAQTELSKDDTINSAAIDAAVSLLRTESGRELTLVTDATTATARTFRPDYASMRLVINDAASISSVVEDGVTLTAGVDYVAEPNGNRSRSGEWRPYDVLVRDRAFWHWDGALYTVTVTAKWGWTQFSPAISEAVKVLAADWLANRSSRNGIVAASSDGFSIGMRTNPLVVRAINAVRGHNGWGVA